MRYLNSKINTKSQNYIIDYGEQRDMLECSDVACLVLKLIDVQNQNQLITRCYDGAQSFVIDSEPPSVDPRHI